MRRAWVAALVLLVIGAAALMANRLLANRLDTVPLSAWAIAGLGMLASYAVRARRLVDEWPTRSLRWLAALRVVLLHNAAVVLLPLRAGEAGYPFLLRQRFDIALADGTASLVWMRLQDAIVLALLVVVAFVPGAPLWLRLLLSLLGLSVAMAALRHWTSTGRPWQGALSRGRFPRLDALVVGLGGALHRGGQRAIHRGWFWSACNWLVKTAALGSLLAQLLDMPLLAAMGAAMLGEAGGGLPLNVPAGFGTYEAGILLGLRGLPAAPAMPEVLGAALMVHIFGLLVGLLCAAIALGAGLPRPVPVAAGSDR